MADFTIHNEQVFPVGATVKAYPVSVVGPVIPATDAGMSAAASAVVQSDGTVTFTGLTAGSPYYAYLSGRWVRFIPGATSPATGHFTYDPDSDTVDFPVTNVTQNGSALGGGGSAFAHLTEDTDTSTVVADDAWSIGWADAYLRRLGAGRLALSTDTTLLVWDADDTKETVLRPGQVGVYGDTIAAEVGQWGVVGEDEYRLVILGDGSLHWGDGTNPADRSIRPLHRYDGDTGLCFDDTDGDGWVVGNPDSYSAQMLPGAYFKLTDGDGANLIVLQPTGLDFYAPNSTFTLRKPDGSPILLTTNNDGTVSIDGHKIQVAP